MIGCEYRVITFDPDINQYYNKYRLLYYGKLYTGNKNMNDIKEQKCKLCGGAMRFDPAKGLLVCDFCGNEVEINGEEEEKSESLERIEGFDFNALNDQAFKEGAVSLPVYNCVSCGAEVIAPAEQMALTCPYCGNNIVLTDKASGGLRPDAVIPFSIIPDSLPGAVRHFYQNKKLLPKGFFSDSTMGKVTGVYVPFWVFGGKLNGRLNYSADKSSSTRSGDYIITSVDHYRLVRDVELSFADVPVDAGGKIDDSLMDSLEPFRTSEAKPFDMRYLAGFTADRFDEHKDKISNRAESRMSASTGNAALPIAGAGYESVSYSGGKLTAAIKARYMLFPVYMFDILHNNERYHFAVNGQTGKVVGKLPLDKNASRMYFLKWTAILSGGMFFLSVLKYLLGY